MIILIKSEAKQSKAKRNLIKNPIRAQMHFTFFPIAGFGVLVGIAGAQLSPITCLGN